MTDGTAPQVGDAVGDAVDDAIALQRVDPVPAPLERPPRAGDLTIAWRVVTALAWISAAAGLAAVWNASVQLGLATWWLGPRSDPRPTVIRLLPFVPAALMVLGAINQIRRLAVFGLIASALIAVVGIVDLGYVRGLGLVELAIATSTALVSVASFSGTYRPVTTDADQSS